MPLFSSAGKVVLITGRGGFHPNVSGTDAPSSSAAGSLGTVTLSGNGQTIALTSQTGTISGDRDVIDPWFTGPVTYSISSGSLPPGYSLNSSTGQITGSYTVSGWNESGTYNFTVRATTADGLHTSDRAYSGTLSVPFLYRQIITTGYILGGYQNSTPYRQVAAMNMATDTTSSKGDAVRLAQAYGGGACSRNEGYLFNASDSWPGTTTETAVFNMRTEVTGTYSPTMNTVNARNDADTIWKEHTAAYICGGGDTAWEKFTFSTQTSALVPGQSGPSGSAEQDGTTAVSDENVGDMWGNAGTRYTYSSETASALVPTVTSGQQKGLSTKLGKGYYGNEGTYNGGNDYRVWIFATQTSLSPNVSKGSPDSGEENQCMGQNWGYSLGWYTAAGQNTLTRKTIYPTNSTYIIPGVTVGGHPTAIFNSAPGAIPGRSSGHCAWRD